MTTYICIGYPPEPGCGKILSRAERKWYTSCCETCMKRWDDRISKWKAGGEDADLDRMFTVPTEVTK